MVKETFELFEKDNIALINFERKRKEIKEISNFEGRPFKKNQMDVPYRRLVNRGVYFFVIAYGVIFCWGKVCPFWSVTSGRIVVCNREGIC